MGYQHLSKRKLKELGKQVGTTHRSPELEKAWASASTLRKQFKDGKPAAELAEEYQINIRSVYRIVRGK